MITNLHEQKIKFQKTCAKSYCIDKSCIAFDKLIAKFEIRFRIKREMSNLSNMYFINQ